MRGALGLYEGRGVKLDHPDRSKPGSDRSVREGFGELRNARYDSQSCAIYADHYYPVNNAFAREYVESCTRFPLQLGFSHNANGEFTNDGDTQIVESIDDVYSVDLVDSPATNRGIFESEGSHVATKKTTEKQPLTVKSLLEKGGRGKSKIRQRLIEQIDAGNVDGDTEVAAVEGDADKANPDKQALRTAVNAVIDDPTLSADQASDAIATMVAEPPAAVTAGTDGPTVESLETKIEDLTAENAVRRLLESTNIDIDDELVESLKPLSQEQRKALIERLEVPAKQEPSRKRPARSAPLKESNQPAEEYASRWAEKLTAKSA